MKKIRWISLILACVLLFSACGNSGETTESVTEGFGLFSSIWLKLINSQKDKPDDTNNSNTTPSSAVTPTAGTNANPAANGATVAQPMDLDTLYAVPNNALPDLHYWSGGQVTYDTEPGELGGNHYYRYWTELDWIEDYVDMLQNNGYTLVDYTVGYKNGYRTWALTCDNTPNAQKIEQQFTENLCHVCISWTELSNYEYTMYASPDLEVCDTGLRWDGSVVEVKPQGESAGAGLVRLKDGSYQTSDGRLTAAVGNAMVIRDGTVYNTIARYELDGEDENVRIEDYYRNESIYFESPDNYLMEGDTLRHYELARWHPIERDDDSIRTNNNGSCLIAVAHGGKWVGPGFNDEYYDALTLRLMYHDEGGDAVYYFYARFADGEEPREVEALCAVDTSHGSGTISDATYLKKGNTVTLKYSYRDYDSAVHTFDWKVVEGADKVSISFSGDTCDVTAKSPGVATVMVTYEYLAEEPDVLTGISRTVLRSIQQEYHFIIE